MFFTTGYSFSGPPPPLNLLGTNYLYILWQLQKISEQLTWDLVLKLDGVGPVDNRPSTN